MKKFVLLFALLFPVNSFANCVCVCINGEQDFICSKPSDPPPICPPRICPIAPPSIEPPSIPTIPQTGDTECKQVFIYNEYTGRYEWHMLCH